jgi:hypothetical protein
MTHCVLSLLSHVVTSAWKILGPSVIVIGAVKLECPVAEADA